MQDHKKNRQIKSLRIALFFSLLIYIAIVASVPIKTSPILDASKLFDGDPIINCVTYEISLVGIENIPNNQLERDWRILHEGVRRTHELFSPFLRFVLAGKSVLRLPI